MMLRILVGLVLLLGTVPSYSSAWWNLAWGHRVRIVLEKNVPTKALSDFTMLVKLNPSRIDYSKCLVAGADLRFVSGDGSILPHEVERWQSKGISIVWVKFPKIGPGNPGNTFWLYYGNANAKSLGREKEVWADQYAGVWHMGEVGTARRILESTKNGFHGTAQNGMGRASQVEGPVGGSLQFNGTNQYILVGNHEQLSFERTDQFSFTAWVKVKDNTTNSFISKMACGPTYRGYHFFTHAKTAKLHTVMVNHGHANIAETRTNVRLDDGKWRYVCATYDGSGGAVGQKLYINGKLSATEMYYNLLKATIKNTQPFRIGSRECGKTQMNGALDEIRVVKGTLSPEWIRAQYCSQADSMLTFSQSEGSSGVLFPRPAGDKARFAVMTVQVGGNFAQLRLVTNPSEPNPVLYIHDASGNLIRAISCGERELEGVRYAWRYQNHNQQAVPTGLYFATARIAGRTISRKLVYVR